MLNLLSRTHRTRWVQIAIVCLSVVGLVWWLWHRSLNSPAAEMTRLREDPLRTTGYRPGVVDRRRVETMDLKLKGKPLFPGPHQVRYKECVIEGVFKPTRIEGPTRPFGLDFYISLRSPDVSDGEWALVGDDRRSQRAWMFNANRPSNQVRQFNDPNLRKYFPPGTYRADLYFEIEDLNMGQNEVYLLGTTSITLLEDQ